MKRYIKANGVNMKTLAEHLEISPQNLNSKLNAKSLRADFIQKVKEIVGRCAVPIPEDVGASVNGSNVNGSHSPNVSQTIGGDAALAAENKLLREQNEFLQNQLKTLLAIMGSK